MTSRATLSIQRRALLSTLLWAWLPSALVLAVVVVISRSSGIRIDFFLRDPTAISGRPFFFGLISNLGILLWAATAAICLFSYAVLSRYSRDSELAKFLLGAGIGTTILCLSDLFRIHETVFPDYFGIREEIVFGVYGLLMVLYLLRFRAVILRTEYFILATSFILFGLSVEYDILTPGAVVISSITGISRFNFFLEDAPKLIGISTWLIYFSRVAAKTFQQEFSNVQHRASD